MTDAQPNRNVAESDPVGIDPRNNPEARTEETNQIPQVARGGVSGTVTPGPQPGAEQPGHDSSGGTADENPIAGVGMSGADRKDTVTPSSGPEYPPSNAGHA